MEPGQDSGNLAMSQKQDNIWEITERIEKEAGVFGAFTFLVLYGLFYLGIAAVTAWAFSAAFGSGYWMTLLCLFLLKLLLS